jgi:bacillithiol biosynthesis cysteine-adding enzyme BshC
MSGGLPVKAQCLPFSQVPHTSRLFLDFLSGSPSLQPFLPRGPHFSGWLNDEAARLRYEPFRRQRVAEILERQNRSWDASPQTLANITRLKSGAAAVVTGQQVGLFGGPLFSIFKALTAVKLAEEATRAGVDCIPVFWLATQDHDLDEIRSVSFPGADASLQSFSSNSTGVAGAPVGSIQLGPEIGAVVEAVAQLLGESETTTLLRESYRPDATYGSAFARLFARLFAEWGVVLLDSADPELNAVAGPLYQAALERAPELEQALLARDRELAAAGYHQQVNITPDSTLLFAVRGGVRVPIHRQAPGNGFFLVAEERIPAAELLQEIFTTPQNFSANVLLRPVVQDYLLPTLAYTGGSAEVAYFAQAGVIYQALLGRTTPVLPRFSATVLEPKPQALLERYGLALPDLFPGPEQLRERLAAQALPQELQSAFEKAGSEVGRSFTAIRDALNRLDKTLVEAANNAEGKVLHQLESLRSRAARAELRQSEVLDRHAHLLSSALFPNKIPQEREIGGVYFLARYAGLLKEIYQVIQTDCFDHQLLFL